jgi:hypothetical protein
MDLQNWIEHHPVGAVFGFIVYFCLLWLLVCFVLSLASGWRSLYNSFPISNRSLPKMSLTNGQFRYIVGYHNVLRLGSDRDGLYLAILFLFRFRHPTLFVPWSEIEILPEKSFLFFRWRSLILGRESRVPLMLKSRVASALLEKRDTQ